jgi:hypothetical protein
MITITISSSIRVKPLRFDMSDLRHGLTAERRLGKGRATVGPNRCTLEGAITGCYAQICPSTPDAGEGP